MIKKEISEVVSKRITLHIEDDFGTQKCWDREIEILTRDMTETIKFIENDCSDDIFCWIGEVFEDIAEKTQSSEFIETIKQRAKKIVNSEQRHSVEIDIRYAEHKLFDIAQLESKQRSWCDRVFNN